MTDEGLKKEGVEDTQDIAAAPQAATELILPEEFTQETTPVQATPEAPLKKKHAKELSTRITKLVLDGFKSFGKRTELLFGPDFNVVLGPNGSGKSNILDGLCFVLGKSSSKSLRAEKSAHLIYNGGKTKQPAKTAEVSIYFDNTSKSFPLPDTEIKVTRIVRQDGLSRYKINNDTKTRQEVVELLNHAKIDPDGYNIILQGDIVRLVEMNAIERRQIIEEIAGISLYEEKKQQALNELAKVDEKLGEAGIILKERDGYLKELKKDRDQALAHKELTDLIRTNKASRLHHVLNRKKKSLDELNQTMQKHRHALQQHQDNIKHVRTTIDSLKHKITEINATIEQKGEVEQVALQKEIETLRIDLATHKTRITTTQNELARLANRKVQLEKNLEEIQQKINEQTTQLSNITAQQNTLKEHSTKLTQEITAFRKKHQIGDETQLDTTIQEIDKKIDELQKEMQAIREQQQQHIREKDKLDFQVQTIDSQIQKIKTVEEEHKQEMETLKHKKTEFKKILLELNELLNADSSMAAQLGDARQNLTSFQEEHAKLSVKKTVIEESAGNTIAVKKVIEQKNKLGTIHGTVSELGSSATKYSLALEIAAGTRMNSVVVDDDKTAARCIKYLKENKLGIATFLPLNKIKGQPITPEQKQAAKNAGTLGFAVDLIQYEPQFKNVFSHVFGSTLIVDKIETARAIGIGTNKMVTLDGDLCEISGAMIGGFRHKKTGSFKDSNLTTALTHTSEKIQACENTITTLTEKRTQQDTAITKLRELKAELEADIIKTGKSLHLDTGDLDATQTYKEELLTKQQEVTKELTKLETLVRDKTRQLTDLKIEKQHIRENINQLRNPTILAELNTFETKQKELQEQLNTLETQKNTLTIQHQEVLLRDQENIHKVQKELAREEKEFSEQHKTLTLEVKTKEKLLHQKEQEQQTFFSEYKQLFEQRNTATQETNQHETTILGIEEKARAEELILNTHTLEETRFKTEIAGIELDLSTYSGVPLNLKKDEETLKKEITESEQKLATLGAVNMRALDIYDAAEKEYNTLVDKKEKLKTEKNSVLNLLEEVEGQKKDIFTKTLEHVNNNFTTIFSQLTTKGSSASLDLENQEQPFEAGLRIKVKLTGQKYLDIRSLSGGEKTMTALAFLFALQEYEPANFYILDEVDAALDKSNSQQLAQLIRQYTSKAQYIVISHNDAMIIEGDTLFGVSMHADRGASNVVSLKV